MKESSKRFAQSLFDEIQSQDDDKDGSFQIENHGGRAMLSVFPPKAIGGQGVTLEAVRKRLQLLKIVDVDEGKLEDILLRSDGVAHEIGRWAGGKAEAASAVVRITPDKMKALLTMSPPINGGLPMTKERLFRILEANHVSYGIMGQTLSELVVNPRYHEEVVVAQGLAPRNGRAGYVKVLFDHEAKGELHEDEQGRVDFKEIHIVKSVPQGSILAEMIDPEPGQDGMDITGALLPAYEGKRSEWKLGSNVKLSDDGRSLLAVITGRPLLDRYGIIRVDEVVRLEQVDYSTGNIDFPGTIIVEKRIADGFKLETSGSIIVEKSMGKAFLRAKGDIVLSGGFMGHDEGVIESEGDIYARFVERGRLRAGGSILIKDASMHSELIAGESIIIRGGRGDLIGGKGVAGKFIVCNKLGAVVETKTQLVVGSPPDLMEELHKLQDEINKRQDILNKVYHTLKPLEKSREKRVLKPEEQEMLEKLREVEKKYRPMLENSQQQYEAAVNSFEPAPGAFVGVLNEMYHGVEIVFGHNRIFRTPLRPLGGKTYLHLDKDGTVRQASKPPYQKSDDKDIWESYEVNAPPVQDILDKQKQSKN